MQVSEQLFIVHEECVNGNFENVKQMFATASGSGAAKSKEVSTNNINTLDVSFVACEFER